MFTTRAFSLTAKRAVGSSRGVCAAHQFQPSTTVATAIPTSNNIRRNNRRSISSSPPLQFSSNSDVGGEKGKEEVISKDKKPIIERWMKWNTSRNWTYEPNHELIGKIGKEETTSPLDQFRDLVPREKREAERVGRAWTVNELRRKSYEDLHKLWYVLYKEKNMLLTEVNLARRHGYQMVQPERRKKVRKSMSAIKRTLGERKRRKIADYRAYLEELKRFNGLVASMKFKTTDHEIEDAMDTEAEKMSSNEKA